MRVLTLLVFLQSLDGKGDHSDGKLQISDDTTNSLH